jgi:hypothetical protein
VAPALPEIVVPRGHHFITLHRGSRCHHPANCMTIY